MLVVFVISGGAGGGGDVLCVDMGDREILVRFTVLWSLKSNMLVGGYVRGCVEFRIKDIRRSFKWSGFLFFYVFVGRGLFLNRVG